MKKSLVVLSLTSLLFGAGCSSNHEAETNEETTTATDSLKEQENLDSLFNAAGNNMEVEHDTSAAE